MLSSPARASLLQPLLADIDLLGRITDESFDDWRADVDRGSFHHRSRRGSVA
jgi:hypothetical protein